MQILRIINKYKKYFKININKVVNGQRDMKTDYQQQLRVYTRYNNLLTSPFKARCNLKDKYSLFIYIGICKHDIQNNL